MKLKCCCSHTLVLAQAPSCPGPHAQQRHVPRSHYVLRPSLLGWNNGIKASPSSLLSSKR